MSIFSCTGGKKVPLRIEIGNGELMQEYFPKHSRMETARMKQDKDTDEDTEVRREYGKKQRGHERKKSRRPITPYLIKIQY